VKVVDEQTWPWLFYWVENNSKKETLFFLIFKHLILLL